MLRIGDRVVSTALGLCCVVVCGCASATATARHRGATVAARAASCVGLTPAQQQARARMVFDGVALAGRTAPGIARDGGVLLSPARFRVLRYLNGHGASVVRIQTAVSADARGRYTWAEDGIATRAGQRWRIYGRPGSGGTITTSDCAGSRRLPAARSNPADASALGNGHWSVLTRSPLGSHYGATVVWDGRALLELGGGRHGDGGAAYDPSRHRWRVPATAPAATKPAYAASVWTGREVFMFGEAATRAGLYDPATDRWRLTGTAPIGAFGEQPTAVWTGRRVIVAGFTPNGRFQLAGYDPATDAWASLHAPISPRHPLLDDAIVATNDGVVLWSLWGRTKKIAPHTYRGDSGVDVFRLRPSGTWTNVTGHWRQHQTVDSPIFTGTRILIGPGQDWCGACSPPLLSDAHGDFVNPRTLAVTPIPHGPLDNIGPQVIWTGAAEIALNTGGLIGGRENVRPGNLAIFNPHTRRWARARKAPKQLAQAPAVWTGDRLFALAQDGHLLAYGR